MPIAYFHYAVSSISPVNGGVSGAAYLYPFGARLQTPFTSCADAGSHHFPALCIPPPRLLALFLAFVLCQIFPLCQYKGAD